MTHVKGELRLGSALAAIALGGVLFSVHAFAQYNLGAFWKTSQPSSSTFGLVQGNYSDDNSGNTFTSMTVIYSGAQLAGDLNVVAVAGNTTPSSVTDSAGNIYSAAIGPTANGTGVSQSIYYCANIRAAAAGANTVTVSYSGGGAAYPLVHILEYSGIATA